MDTIDALAQTYDNMLGALSGILAKASEDGRGEVLLEARLADDMYPLATQVRFLANMPGEAFALLGGPAFLPADDDPRDFDAAQELIADARARVEEAGSHRFKADDEGVVLALPNGMTFDLSAANYVRDWALPQFYFHSVAAYAILRKEGIAIGKSDYVPHMFAYLREDSGTNPAGSA